MESSDWSYPFLVALGPWVPTSIPFANPIRAASDTGLPASSKSGASPFPWLPGNQGKQLPYLLCSHVVQENEEVHLITTADTHTCLHLFQILSHPWLQNGSLLPASAKTTSSYYCTVISDLQNVLCSMFIIPCNPYTSLVLLAILFPFYR